MAFGRIAATSTADNTALGTVPAGKVWVILEFICTNTQGSQLEVTGQTSGLDRVTVSVPPKGGYNYVEPGSKIVLAAGDTLAARTATAGTFNVHVSYLEEAA